MLGSNPPAGTTLRPGTAVDLFVSKGPAPGQGRATGPARSAARAEQALTAQGLEVDRRARRSSPTPSPRADVISQTRPAAALFRGDTVQLVVSKGPELVEVPGGLRATGVEAATQLLEELGFKVDVDHADGYLGLGLRLDVDPGPARGAQGQHDHPVDHLTTPRRLRGCPPCTAPTRRTTLLATGALLAVTALLGLDVLPDPRPAHPGADARLPGRPVRDRQRHAARAGATALGRLSRESRRQAVVLGCLYGVAQILQTAGLAHTPASVSGFITGMYVVATPVFAALLLLARGSAAITWGAVALAIVGLGVLTLGGLSVGYGEALTFVAAMLYALHIVGLGAWSEPEQALGHVDRAADRDRGDLPGRDGTRTASCCPRTRGDWLSVLYMAVFAGAGAMIGQTWAQAHLPPTRAAIIMSMEPVFAAFFAVLLGGESR